MAFSTALRDLSRRLLTTPLSCPSLHLNDGTELIDHVLPTSDTNIQLIPLCRHIDPQAIEQSKAKEFRSTVVFGGWKKYVSANQAASYRPVLGEIQLASLKFLEVQPERITILLFGSLYEVVKITPQITTVKNCRTGQTALINSHKRVIQVQANSFVNIEPLKLF